MAECSAGPSVAEMAERTVGQKAGRSAEHWAGSRAV